VNSILDSVMAIASGDIGGAATAVEQSLAKAVPMVITFLADLLGLGGISHKVQEIIGKVKAPIQKGIDWLVQKAVALGKKLWGMLTGKGKPKEDGADGKGAAQLRPLAQRAAQQGWEAAQKQTQSEVQTKSTVQGSLGSIKPTELPGTAQVTYEPVVSGKKWQIQATVQDQGERAEAEAGDGWVAEDEQGQPWLAGKNMSSIHQGIIQDTTQKLQAATSSPEGSVAQSYEEKQQLARDLELQGQQKIDQQIKGIRFSVKMEALSEAEKDKRIATSLSITPNTETWKFDIPLAGSGSGLESFVNDLLKATSGKTYATLEEPLAVCTSLAKSPTYSGSAIQVNNQRIPLARAKGQFKRSQEFLEIRLTSGSENHTLYVDKTTDDNLCPSCGATTGNTGVSAAHAIVSQSIITRAIENTLTTYGAPAGGDLFATKIIGYATSNQISSVYREPQNQCSVCESTQGPYSLLQRARGAAPVGAQWPTDVPTQEEITTNHIAKIVADVQSYIQREHSKYGSSPVTTNIVSPGKLGSFASDLRSEMFTLAQ